MPVERRAGRAARACSSDPCARSAARASSSAAVALDDARVVAGREPRGADAPREREQLGEAEAAVAADARVRRLAARVAAHERRRRPRGGTPRAGRASRAGARARGRSRARRSPRSASSRRARRPAPFGSSQRRSVTPTALGPASSSATALSTPPLIATATRVGIARRADRRADRVRERVDRQRLAADRRRLEQGQPDEVALEPGRVGRDDPLAVDRQPTAAQLAAARRVSEELDHAARVARVRPGAWAGCGCGRTATPRLRGDRLADCTWPVAQDGVARPRADGRRPAGRPQARRPTLPRATHPAWSARERRALRVRSRTPDGRSAGPSAPTSATRHHAVLTRAAPPDEDAASSDSRCDTAPVARQAAPAALGRAPRRKARSARTPPSYRARVNLASQVGAVQSVGADPHRLALTQAPFHVALVLHGARRAHGVGRSGARL